MNGNFPGNRSQRNDRYNEDRYGRQDGYSVARGEGNEHDDDLDDGRYMERGSSRGGSGRRANDRDWSQEFRGDRSEYGRSSRSDDGDSGEADRGFNNSGRVGGSASRRYDDERFDRTGHGQTGDARRSMRNEWTGAQGTGIQGAQRQGLRGRDIYEPWTGNRQGREDRNQEYNDGMTRDRGQDSGSVRQAGQHAGKGPKGYQRADERIREDVSEALARHDEIDATEIEVEVAHGEVTLNGTVSTRLAKRLAEEAVEELSGVKDVQNRLRIQPQSSHQGAGQTGLGNMTPSAEHSTLAAGRHSTGSVGTPPAHSGGKTSDAAERDAGSKAKLPSNSGSGAGNPS